MLTPANFLAHTFVFHILCALEESGVIGMLKEKKKGVSAKEMAARYSLDQSKLEMFCDFLVVNAPEVLVKKEGMYFLTSAFLGSSWQNCLYFGLAYKPVLGKLHSLLQGDEEYGEDIRRNGRYLQNSSAIYNAVTWDFIIDRLQNMGITSVVDCGCGGGDFLLRACDVLTNVKGLGVDTDREVVEFAKQSLCGTEYENRLSLTVGDVADPETWEQDVPESTHQSQVAFTGITVWHEFLYHGDEYLLKIFSKYRSLFPGSVFVVAEYNGFLWEDLPTLSEPLRESASVYQFVHPLTHQGMPRSKERWLEIFAKANIKILEATYVQPNSTVYIGIL